MKRAFLVGIDKYPKRYRSLKGCVNDVAEMSALLVSRYKFAEPEIRVLKDAAATKRAILEGLEWLISNISDGDRCLFHFCGHGTQMPTRNKELEIDGLDEVICPADFAFDDEHGLRDKEFVALFKKIPVGACCLWVSDSCHSGDLIDMRAPKNNRSLVNEGYSPKADYRVRRLVPPSGMTLQIKRAREKGIGISRLDGGTADLQVALLAGCQTDEQSKEWTFDGRSHGALTYFLLRNLKTHGSEPLVQLVSRITTELSRLGMRQVPQLNGAPHIVSQSFLEFFNSPNAP